MKYILFLSLFLVGCTDKALVLENAKQLCACQSGLWYIVGNRAKCNNGTWFMDLDKVNVYDAKCNL